MPFSFSINPSCIDHFSMGESRCRSVGLRDGEERADGVDYLRHGTSLPPYVNNLHANMHVSRSSLE
jgi:hypothetical protein